MSSDVPQHQSQIVNPLLQKIKMPGETVRLPSQGLLYTDVLSSDVTNGEVHVHPMTAMDEIVIKSPDMLFSGAAVREIFGRCIPDIVNVDGMFAKDIDFLMLALRKVSYGNEYDVKFTHDCENAKANTYTCLISEAIGKSKGLDPTTVDAQYTEKLPNSQVVRFTPMRYVDVVKIMQTTDENVTPDQQEKGLFDALCSLIYSVDEVKDPGFIFEWLTQLPVSMVKTLMKRVEVVSDWGPSYEYERKCKDCGEMITISVPINPLSFFT